MFDADKFIASVLKVPLTTRMLKAAEKRYRAMKASERASNAKGKGNH